MGTPIQSYTTGNTPTIEDNIIENTTQSGNLFFANSGVFTMKDNQLSNLDPNSNEGIQLAGNWNGTTGTTVSITGNTWENSQMTGINASDVSGNISSNTFSNIAYYGILVANNSSPLTITGNTFSNITNPVPSVATYGAGVRFYTPSLTGPVSITGNTFANDAIGVAVRPDASADNLSTISVTGNIFTNDTKGVYNGAPLDTPALNATNNWWGDVSGPTDTVSGDGSTPDTNPGGVGSPAVGAVNYGGWCFDALCTPDTTPPVVTITPVAGSLLHGTEEFTITVTDNRPLDPSKNKNIWVYLYNSGGTQKSQGMGVDLSSGTGTFTVDTTKLDDGDTWLDVGQVQDAAGNTTPGDTYFKDYVIDNTAPTVTVTPVAGSTLSGTEVFDITINDAHPASSANNHVWVYLYNAAPPQTTQGASVDLSSGTGTFTVDTTKLANGDAWLDVGQIYDAASNVNGPTDNYFKDYNINNVVAPTGPNAPEVITEPASGISASDATLNATNGNNDAGQVSFWVSATSPIDTTSPNIPAGVYSTPVLSNIAANAAFTDPLSLVTTAGITTGGVNANMPAITPGTTYYYVAWSNVGGTWYPGAEKSFTTAPAAPTLLTPTSGTILNTNDFMFTWNPVTSAASPITYQFQSSMDSTAVGGVLTNGLWTSGTLTDPSIHSTGAPDGTWYWQVRAQDSAGTWSTWSPIWSVVLNTAAPTPSDVEVHIFKYIDGVQATATNANSATFPMETTFTSPNLGNYTDTPFTLSPTGWGTTDSAYEASFVGSQAGANYSAWEMTNGTVVGASCDAGDPFALVGYSTGSTLAAAQTAAVSSVVPSFTNLQSTQYEIVWNQTCTPAPVVIPLDPATPSATTNAASSINSTGATLNGTNGGVSADNTSFWWGTTSAGPFTPSADPSSEYPTTGWNHDGGLGLASAGAPFNETLGSLSPSTQYEFVAWSQVGGTWYPGTILNFTTAATPAVPAPVANAQTVVAGEAQPFPITLTSSDSGSSYSVAANPTHGTLSGTGANLTYTSNAGYIGSDSFTFVANNGSASAPATVSITVQGPPILTVNPANPAKLAVNSIATYSDNGATIASPASDTELGIVTLVDGGATTTPPNIDLKTPGTHTVLYVATDKFGNEGTATRTVIVSGPPVITLVGDSTVDLTVGATYTEQGATATDLADGTDAVTPSGTVNTAVAATYTITYNATDSVGNTAVPVTRTVVVTAAPAPRLQTLVTGGGGGGNGPISGSMFVPSFTGSVLGASTTTVPTSSGTGGTSSGTPFVFVHNMRLGSKLSPDVTELQHVLTTKGFFSASLPTGEFGPKTRAAVIAYQHAHGIQATGNVYVLTRNALNAGL